MSDKTKDVDAALEDAGFRQVRHRKHLIYKNNEGKTITASATPSDWRASRNQLRDIRRGLNPATRTGGAVDAELPKQGKKRGGRARFANVFNPYAGLARQSVMPTKQETIKTLQGYLRSRDAYRFRSELVKEFVRRINGATDKIIHNIEHCLRDFEEMQNFVEAGGDPAQVPVEKRGE